MTGMLAPFLLAARAICYQAIALAAGATGLIGTPLVAQLLAAKHEVVAVARTQAAAKSLQDKGATPLVGDVRAAWLLAHTLCTLTNTRCLQISNPEPLFAAATQCDAVLHLAWLGVQHMEEATALELAMCKGFVKALAGSNKPLVISSGALSAGCLMLGHNP